MPLTKCCLHFTISDTHLLTDFHDFDHGHASNISSVRGAEIHETADIRNVQNRDPPHADGEGDPCTLDRSNVLVLSFSSSWTPS